jgi:hypothetical protein
MIKEIRDLFDDMDFGESCFQCGALCCFLPWIPKEECDLVSEFQDVVETIGNVNFFLDRGKCKFVKTGGICENIGVTEKASEETKIDLYKVLKEDFSNSVVYEHSVSPFSMQYFTPSFYLLARSFLKTDHPFSTYLIKYLIENQINGESWSHVARDRMKKPYSFCTALSLYSLWCWACDSLTNSVVPKRLPSFDNLYHKIRNTSHKSPKVFLSYSKVDKDAAKRIASSLKKKGYLVWYDEWEIKVGDSIIEKITNGIVESDFLLVLLSKNSVESKWVREELNAAKMREINKRNVFILPILLDDCRIPILISDKKYADMRNSYRKGMADLLKTLKEC